MLKQNPKVEEPYAGDPLVRVCEGDRMKVLSLLGASLAFCYPQVKRKTALLICTDSH